MSNFLYTNGEIVTMNDSCRSVEAVVTEKGEIVYAGDKADTSGKYPDAELVDLKGRTMLPGFIDSHSHYFLGTIFGQFVRIYPGQIGEVNCIDDLINCLKNHMDRQAIIGFGFDNAMLKEKKFQQQKILIRSLKIFLSMFFINQVILVSETRKLSRCTQAEKQLNILEMDFLKKATAPRSGRNSEPCTRQAVMSRG